MSNERESESPVQLFCGFANFGNPKLKFDAGFLGKEGGFDFWCQISRSSVAQL